MLNILSSRYFSFYPICAIRFQIHKINKLVKQQIWKLTIYYSVAIEGWRVFFDSISELCDFFEENNSTATILAVIAIFIATFLYLEIGIWNL